MNTDFTPEQEHVPAAGMGKRTLTAAEKAALKAERERREKQYLQNHKKTMLSALPEELREEFSAWLTAVQDKSAPPRMIRAAALACERICADMGAQSSICAAKGKGERPYVQCTAPAGRGFANGGNIMYEFFNPAQTQRWTQLWAYTRMIMRLSQGVA